MCCNRASAAPPPAIGTSRDGRERADARTSYPRPWPSLQPSRDISSIFAIGHKHTSRERTGHKCIENIPRLTPYVSRFTFHEDYDASIYDTHWLSRPLGPGQRGYGSDHPEAVLENDQAHGTALGVVLRLEETEGRVAGSELFPESSPLSRRDDSVDPRQLRLRLAPPPRPPGAA